MIITRKDAKTLLSIATSYDYLSGNAGVAVTEEMIEDHSQRLMVLNEMVVASIWDAAPVIAGWRVTNEWIQEQTVI